mmetsp:Transcript_80850/g.145906  ORF Transcript_80850/g.145906 Transcript_80850/m.145906 type:complete len:218 (+) Transcript_80850:619-1272(+)
MTGWQALNMATKATCTRALKCHSIFRLRMANTSSWLRPDHCRSKRVCSSSSMIVRPTPWNTKPNRKVSTTERTNRTVIVVRSRTAARISRLMSCQSCLRKLLVTGPSEALAAKDKPARPCGVLQSSAAAGLVDGSEEDERFASARVLVQAPMSESVFSLGSVCIRKMTKSAGLKPTGHRYPSLSKCGPICSRSPSHRQRPLHKQITWSTSAKISLLG